jgi:hypothetical protein
MRSRYPLDEINRSLEWADEESPPPSHVIERASATRYAGNIHKCGLVAEGVPLISEPLSADTKTEVA